MVNCNFSFWFITCVQKVCGDEQLSCLSMTDDKTIIFVIAILLYGAWNKVSSIESVYHLISYVNTYVCNNNNNIFAHQYSICTISKCINLFKFSAKQICYSPQMIINMIRNKTENCCQTFRTMHIYICIIQDVIATMRDTRAL